MLSIGVFRESVHETIHCPNDLGGAENLVHIEEAMGRHLVRAYALPTDGSIKGRNGQ
jgi:hypothetical protein